MDDAATLLASIRITRIHTTGSQAQTVRYVKEETRGKASFGEGYEAVDINPADVFDI